MKTRHQLIEECLRSAIAMADCHVATLRHYAKAGQNTTANEGLAKEWAMHADVWRNALDKPDITAQWLRSQGR